MKKNNSKIIIFSESIKSLFNHIIEYDEVFKYDKTEKLRRGECVALSIKSKITTNFDFVTDVIYENRNFVKLDFTPERIWFIR